MIQNNRQRLVSMVRGGTGRIEILRFKFGNEDSPSERLFVDESEMDKFIHLDPENPFCLLMGCRPELREETLRERPCLVRRGGRFVAVNPEKEGTIYLIEN